MRSCRIARSLEIAACVAFVAGVAWLGAGWSGGETRAAARDAQTNPDRRQTGKVPVLVELFTAEGCSSCPPADALLGVLDRQQPIPNARIIVLSEHVDYWNEGGWRDRFSSPEITERQKGYGDFFRLDDVYTPQMVVNGAVQLNGTDAKGIRAALIHAADGHPLPLQIASVQIRGKEVTFTLRNGMPATPKEVNVYAALVDPEDTTQVSAGENRGRTLRHFGVVRVLERVGGSSRTQSLGEKPFVFKGDVPGKASLDGMRLVVFAQAKNLGPVVGADQCLITGTAAKADGGVGPCPVSGG